MAFKEVQDLGCDNATALGGINKKTGKKNPTQVEGYYLGTREVEARLSRSGKASLHIFQTAKGKLGVWGKTDLDRKMKAAAPGNMIRVTYSGTRNVPTGIMHTFKVEVDADNTIDVGTAPEVQEQAETEEDIPMEFANEEVEETAIEEEEAPVVEEQAPLPPRAPKVIATAPTAAQQNRVKQLLQRKAPVKTA
jgi:hypothetical protein